MAHIALERMHVNAMAGSQDVGVAGAHEVGISLAFSNGVPEGVAEIQQDLTSLDRALVAGTVGLAALIQLAEGLHTLGQQSVMPVAARTGPQISEVSPTADLREDLMSNIFSGPAHSRLISDASHPQISAPAEVAAQFPRSVADLERGSLVPALSMMPSLDPAGTDTPQDHWPMAPDISATDVSVAQISPGAPRSTAAVPNAGRPVDQLFAMSAPLAATPLDAIQNSEFASAVLTPTTVASITSAPTTVAPMTVVPTKARGKDLTPNRSTPAFETMIAAARTQEPLVSGSSAPPTAPPAVRAASVSPVVVPRTEASGDQAMPADVRQPPSVSRQSPEAADEPRQGLLILDGTQLGRWIMDRIARQASRPVAGTTGIDPRISPTFPGAPASV